MDLGNSIVKTPEAESETPTRIQPAKPSPFTNGVLKRRHHHHHHHPIVVTYKECLKNHAASIGAHAVDGCGEFMPSPTSNPAEPTTLRCAACGCHRNFHRRDPDDAPPHHSSSPALEYQPHHRHQPLPPPPPRPGSPNNSSSPPPISSSYAPHMLLALSHSSLSGPPPDISGYVNANASTPSAASSGNRKRFRTKFTQDQKERMLELAERVGWKMQKKDEDVINESCTEIGVDKGVFKVWMHNNKNSASKKEPAGLPPPQLSSHSPGISTPPSAASRNGISYSDVVGYQEHNQQGRQDIKPSIHSSELNQLHLRMNSGTTAHALGTNVTSSA